MQRDNGRGKVMEGEMKRGGREVKRKRERKAAKQRKRQRREGEVKRSRRND